MRSFSKNVVSFPGSLSQEKEPRSFLVFFLGSLNQETEPFLKFLVYLMQIMNQESCTNSSLPQGLIEGIKTCFFFTINKPRCKNLVLKPRKKATFFLGSYKILVWTSLLRTVTMCSICKAFDLGFSDKLGSNLPR